MTDAQLEALLRNLESDRVELKEAISDSGVVRQAICAFANDMPNHNSPGVVFVGVRDDGTCANLPITDQLLQTLANMRSDGNILPFPTMTVQRKVLRGCELAAVIVYPSYTPPVRYNGRIWIRVGPRRATATAEEERRLNEKRRNHDLPYDLHPLRAASLNDLDLELFERTYLPATVAQDVLEQNQRTLEQQLSSVRFVSASEPSIPTVVGVLAVGKAPVDHIPGAYVQFLRIDGIEFSDPILDRKECHGPLTDVLRQLDELIKTNIRIAMDVTSASTEIQRPDHSVSAIQQLIRNAVMHRDYQTSNAPIRMTWFSDRVEIQNPGGPFGQVTRQNFGQPGITDYRNPNVAEAMRNLGFVQRFGVGIQIARKALEENNCPPLQFEVEENYVLAIVRSRQ
jgi:ATP-dependent DNA helicase RecG